MSKEMKRCVENKEQIIVILFPTKIPSAETM